MSENSAVGVEQRQGQSLRQQQQQLLEEVEEERKEEEEKQLEKRHPRADRPKRKER